MQTPRAAALLQRQQARVVCAAMQKGGVGKTTSVINLARRAAIAGLRVLVLDMDPQGNSTDALTVEDLPEDQVSIADAILPADSVPARFRLALREVIVSTIWDGVDLAPVTSSAALDRAEKMIQGSQEGRELRLREALAPEMGNYDLVLIDNAPSLGLLMANSLAAAPGRDEHDQPNELVLVVIEADRWSTKGLVRLREAVERAQAYTNPELGWGGLLISKWRNTEDEREKLDELGKYFPQAPLWGSRTDTRRFVPLWVRIKKDINEGIGLDQSRDPRLRVLSEDVYGWALQQLEVL